MTKTHLDAAGQMVSNREFADLAGNAAGDALNDDSARQLSRRAVSYGIVMLTIEGAADAANPDVQPPLSEQMRATARERYGERVDQQLAAIPVFPFGKA